MINRTNIALRFGNSFGMAQYDTVRGYDHVGIKGQSEQSHILSSDLECVPGLWCSLFVFQGNMYRTLPILVIGGPILSVSEYSYVTESW